jgi:hypothetical protein
MNQRIWTLLFACVAGCGSVESPATGTVHVRVAHISPDAPAVDFCVASHGSTQFTGPILTQNGHLTGLAYGNVTKYFDLASDQYDVRLVPPGAANCDTALGGLPDFTDLPLLPPETSATIAAEGLVAFGTATPFALKPYVDDASVDAAKAKLRFIHASPGTPPVDVGLGSGANFAKVFSDVAFGNIAVHAPLDAAGFVETMPVTSPVAARLAGQASDALVVPSVTLGANAIATAFAIGGKTGASTNPLGVLICVDNGPASGLLATCTQ